MIKYFVNEEDYHRFTSGVAKKVKMRCPDCGTIKNHSINKLHAKKYMPCVCGESISIPNKFSYLLFVSLKNQLEYYEREWSPSWAGLYKFDNYFIINNKEYVVEIDGELGHGKKTFGPNSVIDAVGLSRDKEKESLLKKHEINLIRIDIPYTLDNYIEKIKESLVNNLSFLFDFSSVNWDLIYEKVYKNTKKAVCDYYMKHKDSVKETELLNEISRNFGIVRGTVIRYLKDGRDYGWCDYKTRIDLKAENYPKVISYVKKYPNLTSHAIAEHFGITSSQVNNYINIARNNGDYISSRRHNIGRIKAVDVYKDGILIKHYNSIAECTKNAIHDFYTKFDSKKIINCCKGRINCYKGYNFKYA